MITTCDVAPVKKFPFLVWGQKCPIYKGLRQCASAPVPYYRSQISVALTQRLSPPIGRARALDKLLDTRGRFLVAEEVKAAYGYFSPRQLAPHLHVHDRISDIVDDLARGRNVEPKRYQQVAKYFDEEERQKWKESPKIKPPLPLQRPRRWHGQSKKRRRKSYVRRALSAEGRS